MRAIERAEGGHGCQCSWCGVVGGGELLLLFDPLMIIIWYCVVFDETVWRRWVFFGVRLSRVNPKETEKDVIAAYLNYAYGRITLLYCNI